MNWCRACVLPDTRPNLRLDDQGVCNACRNFELRKEIDWEARRTRFERVCARAQAQAQGYDCVIPVSGGKDSTWQTRVCLDHGLRPLAVTWRTPARTRVGQQNLDSLIRMGVDHIDYSIDPTTESLFMARTFEKLGSTAVPMPMAIFSIPLQIAARFKIPLVVWGENSAFEYGQAEEADTGFELNESWLKRYGVTHGTTALDWLDQELTAKRLLPYMGANARELKSVKAVFLGYYFPWDPEQSRRVATACGFQEAPRAATGHYNYADIDDEFISIHHFMKYYKFGFTRLFDNLSLEIRHRRLTRGQALETIRQAGPQVPHGDVEKLCRFLGWSVSHFWEVAERFRNLDIWKHEDGRWSIPDYLVSGEKW